MNEQAPFSLHRNFADNLRSLCLRHGSIAAVCRAIGMNRQQFNKYLAASTLPNAATLEKLATFFGVAPETLFLDPLRAGAAKPFGGMPFPLPGLPAAALENMRQSSLRTGCYHVYAPWPRDPSRCERGALYVYRSAGFTFFARFSKLRPLGQRQRYVPRTRHDGIVLESDTGRFLLSRSRKGLGDTSLLSFGIGSVSCDSFQSGIALVMDSSASPQALRTTLVYRGDHGYLRRTLAEAGVLPLSDLSIPEEVRQSVSGPAAQLSAFSLLDGLGFAAQRQAAT